MIRLLLNVQSTSLMTRMMADYFYDINIEKDVSDDRRRENGQGCRQSTVQEYLSTIFIMN